MARTEERRGVYRFWRGNLSLLYRLWRKWGDNIKIDLQAWVGEHGLD